ncbi:hypothetical protein BDQ17DRAFT_1349623 [Cyathus striatus]|nr:hypothetical protein BDQ17DRAFT_1349623 [Cyathus striatus]
MYRVVRIIPVLIMFSLLTLMGVCFRLMVGASSFSVAERAPACLSITSGTYIITASDSNTDVRLDKNLVNKGLWLEDDPSNPPDSGMWILTNTTGGYFIRNVLLDANVTSDPYLSGGMRGTAATPFEIECAGNGMYTVKEVSENQRLWTVKPSETYHIPGYADVTLAPSQGHSTQHFLFTQI